MHFVLKFGKVLVFALVFWPWAVPAQGGDTTLIPPYIEISNSLDPDVIWKTGTGQTPDQATVTLRIDGHGGTIIVNYVLDVILVTDNSTSMWKRYPGDRDTIAPTRIQGTYNACANFVTDFLDANDRVSHIRFAGLVDTVLGFTSDFNLANAKMDTNICGWNVVKGYVISGNDVSPGGLQVSGTAVWTSILAAVQYAMANRRPGVIPVIIAMSDGDDNASGSYGHLWKPGYPNLGTTQAQAVNTVVNAINAWGDSIKVFTINLGQEVNKSFMEQIAQAGNGSYSFSATGEDLDSVYQEIGRAILRAAAMTISPDSAMISDVLPPAIEYIDGSWGPTANNTATIDSFQANPADSLTELKFFVSRINVDEVFEVSYDIRSDRAGRHPANYGTGTSNPQDRYSTVKYRDYLGVDVVVDTFDTKYLTVADTLVTDSVSIIATAIDTDQVEITFDIRDIADMLVDTLYLYWSYTGWVTDNSVPSLALDYAALVAGDSTATVTGLHSATQYYFTVGAQNYFKDVSDIDTLLGDTAMTFSAQSFLEVVNFPTSVKAGDYITGFEVTLVDENGAVVASDDPVTVAWNVTAAGGILQSPLGHQVQVPDTSQQFWQGVIGPGNMQGELRLVRAGEHTVTICVTLPTDSVLCSRSLPIMVLPGDGYKTEIRNNKDDVYDLINTLEIDQDSTLYLYAGLYDAMGNYIRELSGDWANTLPTAPLQVTDTMVTHVYREIGTDTVSVSHTSYIDDTLIVLVRDARGPALQWGYAGDRNGDGYLDSFVVYFSENLMGTTTITGNAANTVFDIQGKNNITVTSVYVDSAESMAVIYARNSMAGHTSIQGERVNQDSDERYQLSYVGNLAITDPFGHDVLTGSITLHDSAGPVLAKAVYHNNKTEGQTDDDTLNLWFSEPLEDDTWLAYQDRADSVFDIIGLGSFGTNANIHTGLVEDDNYLVVYMGAGGEEIVTGGDSVRLVPGTAGDKRGNPAAENNQAVIVHMPWKEGVILDMVNYPNPFKAGFNGSFEETGAQTYRDVRDVYTHDKGTLIKYTLSQHADLELSIYSLLGVLTYRALYKSGELGGHEGVNYVYWDGSNGKGRLVESGAYVLIVKAVTADGTTDKAKRKVGVVRE